MGNTIVKVANYAYKAVVYVGRKVMDFFFPIKTQLKFQNDTNTKLQEIRIESIGDTYFNTIILASPNDQTTVAFTIRRVDDDCLLKVNLSFTNNLHDIFEINQSYAANRASSFEFKHTLYSHKITHQRTGDKTMRVTIALTQEQLDNDLAEELIKDALSKAQKKRFKEALSKLEEAQKKALSSTIKDKIRNGFARVLNSQGLDEEFQGFNLENQDMPDEAASKLNNAKACFQRAQEYSSSTEQSENLERVSCKINGNNLINEGNDLIEQAQLLIQQAERLKDNSCYTLALKDCNFALDKCKRAEEFFREGAKRCNDDRFETCLNFVRETREEINQIKVEVNLKQCNAKRTEQSNAFKKETKKTEYRRQI